MPPPNSHIKTNRLTIYMLKSGYQNIHDIVDSIEGSLEIEGVGQFVSERSFPHPPDWVENFFGSRLGNDLGILTSSAKGLLIVSIQKEGETITFAISFGVGRHLLKDGVVEDRFGLKVVLNSVDQASFRSIDKTTLGSVPKHSREQMSRDVTPADFGIDIEQDLISSVTARSRDPRFGKILTGKDALYLSTKVDASNIKDFLSHCVDRYRSTDYKTNFDWIDQISEVRNSVLAEELTILMVQKINRGELDKVWMAVPEVIDWSDIAGFRYQKAVRAEIQEDLDLEKYIDLFTDGNVTADNLASDYVFAISAREGREIIRWSVMRCIYAEVAHNNKVYILNSNKWYEIAQGFSDQVNRDYANIPDSAVSLPDYTSGDEAAYNAVAAAALGNACCMDGEVILHGGGHSRIEFCDIFSGDRKIIHVKKYGQSSVLSHLFSQGVVSGELFVSDEEFRRKLNAKLPRGYKLTNPRSRPNAGEHEIVYAIISKSDNPLEIPFFSKVTLRNAKRRLNICGYTVTKKKIPRLVGTNETTAE